MKCRQDEVDVEEIVAEPAVESLYGACYELYLEHQAQGCRCKVLSTITPTAMIFVPSIGGVSHHPAERTADADVINGANALLHTVLQAGGG